MAHALNINMTLQVLNLNHNQISDKGVTALAHALNGNTTLQQLGLGNNEIGDEGVMTLASLLNGNTTLRILPVVNGSSLLASLTTQLPMMERLHHFMTSKSSSMKMMSMWQPVFWVNSPPSLMMSTR